MSLVWQSPRFFESVTGGFPSDRGIPTKVVRYFLGMTVLLFVQFFFSETAPISWLEAQFLVAGFWKTMQKE